MPKSNQHLWDDLFNGFINQIDRAKAHFKVSSGAGAIKAKSLCAKQADGCATSRTAQDILASDSSYDPAPVGTQAPPAGITYHGNLARYVAENAVVPAKREPGGCYGAEEATADDGGCIPELPEYMPEELDEPYWSDSLTARELQESRGKAK